MKWRAAFGGDRLVAAVVLTQALLMALFIFYPVARALAAVWHDAQGRWAPALAGQRLLAPELWSLACVAWPAGAAAPGAADAAAADAAGGTGPCGVALHSLGLALLVGLLSTAAALVLALAAARARSGPVTVLARVLSVLPLVTPPFVIALALVVLFGRAGLVTGWLAEAFGLPRSRWLYGWPGVAIAQVLAFTPVAFLMLQAALAAISPSLEEAAQTLRAGRGRVLRTVTLPLLKPALANAFLLGFVESLADFANPMVLAGSFELLSTQVFFAVAGAQHEPGRAAALALVLLAFTLGAFALQQRWLGRASYVGVGGKGDGGLPAELPAGLRRLLVGFTLAWAALTLACYAVIAVGGFVKDIGRRDFTPVWSHLATGFGLAWDAGRLRLTGSAWDSLITTVGVSALSAPLTALMGLLAAWVITRHRFAGRRAFEFMTLVSFAVPGTVIGVAWIVAFNAPPLELTGGLSILVLCFVFRNMPVGVRAGVAALAQIDRSLDEASATLRAGTVRTLTRVLLPLLKPAIVTTLVFSFTHAMTAVSAVIFLATAQHNLATVYIIGRVEAGEYALAIACSLVLMALMGAVLLLLQAVMGRARLGRRGHALPLATGVGA